MTAPQARNGLNGHQNGVTTHTPAESILTAKWTTVLDRLRTDVDHAVLDDAPSLHVDFRVLDRWDPELADILLERPLHALSIGEDVLSAITGEQGHKSRLRLRLKGLPPHIRLLPRDVHADRLGRLVTLQAMVVVEQQIRPRVLDACWQCRVCDNREQVLQDEPGPIKDPAQCTGCEKTGPWKLLQEHSRYTTIQVLKVQESPDAVRGGTQPTEVRVLLRDDLVQGLEAGDKCLIHGVPTAQHRRSGQSRLQDADLLLEAIAWEPAEDECMDTQATPEEAEAWRRLAERPGIHRELAQCIAPSIHGLAEVKLSILLSLAGGVTRRLQDGSMENGRIHVLVAGDPGTAKSKLIDTLDRYAPRCVIVDCGTASGPGLSASVERVERDDRGYVLKAGALVRADLGVAALDELGRLDDDACKHLLTAMASGVVRIEKAGKAVLRSRTTVVAAMNPRLGERFDAYGGPPASQLRLPAALLSRFGLVWCLVDRVDEERDRAMARAIRSGGHDQEVLLGAEELRRWIAHAQSLEPVVDDEAAHIIEDTYVELRRSGVGDDPGADARRIAGLHRLTEAAARLRLSPTAGPQDARLAVDLVRASLASMGAIDAQGQVDGDLWYSGTPHDQTTRMRLMRRILKDSCRERGWPHKADWASPSTHDLVEAATQQGISAEDAEKALEKLRRDGHVYWRGGRDTWAPL